MRTRSVATVVLMGLSLAGCASMGTTTMTSGGEVALRSSPDLRTAMRKLWADHVVWTRDYIIEAVAGAPGAPAALNRLMKNQEDIGNAIAPFYGSAAGAKLTDLLKQHISIAGELVAAAAKSDDAKVSDADRRWHPNAADIATFLSGANPNWSRDALLGMLNNHLSLTTQEATARIQKRWTDDAGYFDQIFNQAMDMADALSSGIMKQFPDKT